MSDRETGIKPRPFRVGSSLFVHIPEVGLCRMGSWGWEPCSEGFLESARNIEKNRKGDE